MQGIYRIMYVAAFGYISYFFSERVFWSFFRPYPEDQYSDFFVTWFVYSLLSYLALGLIHHYHVTDWKRLFLVAAVYGWLIEGSVVTTMYGTTMGMWATISYTGLAWHALFTGLFGWFFLYRSLMGMTSIRSYLMSIGVFGVAWGLWALNWGYESVGWTLTPDAFSMHALVFMAPLPLAYFIMARGASLTWLLSRWLVLLYVCFFGGLYVYWNVTMSIFPRSLALLLLVPFTLCILHRSLSVESMSGTPTFFQTGVFSWRRALLFYLALGIALSVYTFAFTVFGAQHTNWIVFLLTCPLGYYVYVSTMWKCGQRKNFSERDETRPALFS